MAKGFHFSFKTIFFLGLCFSFVSQSARSESGPNPTLPAGSPATRPAGTNTGPAGSAQKAKPKSQFNSQIFESESTESSWTGIVKVVREVQDEAQVFMEAQQGYLILNMNSPKAGALQNRLVHSQKNKKSVTVIFNTESRQILDVTRSEE